MMCRPSNSIQIIQDHAYEEELQIKDESPQTVWLREPSEEGRIRGRTSQINMKP
jgi:hypothetical protein